MRKLVIINAGLILSMAMPLAAVGTEISAEESERIQAIARDGMAEVELAKLAQSKAKSPSVRAYAKQLAQDHSDANAKLKAAAAKENVKLPTDLSDEQKAQRKSLSAAPAGTFDQQYTSAMVNGHEKAIAALEDEATQGTAEFKKWAESVLPTVKKHWQEAKDLKRKFATASAQNGSQKD